MPYRINQFNGVYRSGSAYPLLSRINTVATYVRTNSFSATATQCKVSIMTVKRIVHKYRQQLSLKAGVGGNHHVTAMKDYVQVYIKFMLMINPKLYLSEIRDSLARDLRLNGPDLPSLVTIHRFIKQEGFTRKKYTRVAIERFTPQNLMKKRKAFIAWRKTVDPRNLFFVDETGFEDFFRAYGRSPSNYPLPSFSSKGKPVKTSVVGVTGFYGVVQVIPFDANYTAAIFEHAIEHIILPVLPNNCYVVMDNASIHNDDRLAQILVQKNITLVKLPPYSYDLNPIEMVFGLVKAYSLRHRDIDNKAVRILTSFNDVSATAVQDYYRHSWRIQN